MQLPPKEETANIVTAGYTFNEGTQQQNPQFNANEQPRLNVTGSRFVVDGDNLQCAQRVTWFNETEK